MIPRSLRLEESERKYQLVLENRKKKLAIANKRRDGLLELVQDCLSGKRKMFGGRFAKPARRNKIILEKISKIETTRANNGNFRSQDQLQKKSIQTLLEFQNKNHKPDRISNAVVASTNQLPHNIDQIVHQHKADQVINEKGFFRSGSTEAYVSPLRPSLLKRGFSSAKSSQSMFAPRTKNGDENRLKLHDTEENQRKVQKNPASSRVTNEPLVDLIHAGVEINRSYFRGSVQAYIGNFNSQCPVMAYIRLQNIDDITLFDSSGFWVEIPNAAAKVSNRKVLGQNILKSIDISVDDSAINFNKERFTLLCEFM